MNRTLLSLLALCTVAISPLRAAEPVSSRPGAATHESPAQRDARLKWFRDARFGMFIHWGLYSQAAGEFDGKPTPGAGEWMMNDMQIPLSQYAKLVSQFDPEKFNANEWVKTAKNAGMKYIVITTKHHEGFALYPSALTDWSIKSTPFKRDPLKELAAACKKEGITLCFYYSIMDWHSPLYAPRKSWNDIDTNAPDFDAYDNYMKGQLKELLTNYGPIGTLWFDGCWEPTWTRARGQDLYHYLRKLQPGLIINNRVGATTGWEEWFKNPEEVGGDFGTPEQSIPANAFGQGFVWEACMTMNDTWGFKKNDHHWKSAETLVRNLIDCSSKGGNYLLNVGPTGEGLIPDASIERLKAVGEWTKANGEAIYGTTASPFAKQFAWGRCTTKVDSKATTLYLHVFDWPSDGELFVPGLKNHVNAAWLLAGKKSLRVEMTEDGVIVHLPKAAPNAISSTIALRIKEPLHVEPFRLVQRRDGSVALPAVEAQLHGTAFRYESGGPLDDIGYWTNAEDWADWNFKLKLPGKYAVSAVIAGPAASAFEISVGGKMLRCATPATGDYFTFKPVELGTVEISSIGQVSLAVRPVKDGWQAINLKSVQLRPVEGKP